MRGDTRGRVVIGAVEALGGEHCLGEPFSWIASDELAGDERGDREAELFTEGTDSAHPRGAGYQELPITRTPSAAAPAVRPSVTSVRWRTRGLV